MTGAMYSAMVPMRFTPPHTTSASTAQKIAPTMSSFAPKAMLKVEAMELMCTPGISMPGPRMVASANTTAKGLHFSARSMKNWGPPRYSPSGVLIL